MCVGCVLVAGVVIATSQVLPVQSQPALFSSNVVTISSKTLSAFPGGSVTLSSNQRSVIKAFLSDNGLAESVVCSVATVSRDSASTKNRFKSRAKAACDYVKRLDPAIKTSVSLRTVSSPASAGRVTLQLRQAQPAIDDAPVAAPPQTKSSFESPFPEVFTTKDLVDSALRAVRSYMDTASQSKTVKLIYQDTIPASERVWISKLAQTSMAVLPFGPGQEPVLVVGSTDQFISSTLQQNGRSGYTPAWWCGSETTYERYCAGGGWAAMNYKDSIEKSLPIADAGKRAVVAHEIYHTWHKTVDGTSGNNNRDPRSPGAMPVWFIEGMANFMGFAIAHHDGATTYAEGRANQVDPYMRSSNIRLNEHIAWEINPYGIGQAAAEYLIASIGVERALGIYRKVGQGQFFADAFKESAGISIEDFYSRFEAARKNF